MNISFGEFDSIMTVVDLLLEMFSKIANYLTFSINDFLDLLNIPFDVPHWIGGDLTPFALMLGVALPLYLGYQFIIWLLNVIT